MHWFFWLVWIWNMGKIVNSHWFGFFCIFNPLSQKNLIFYTCIIINICGMFIHASSRNGSINCQTCFSCSMQLILFEQNVMNNISSQNPQPVWTKALQKLKFISSILLTSSAALMQMHFLEKSEYSTKNSYGISCICNFQCSLCSCKQEVIFIYFNKKHKFG